MWFDFWFELLFIVLYSGDKAAARLWFPLLNTQYLKNSAENRIRNVLNLVSLPSCRIRREDKYLQLSIYMWLYRYYRLSICSEFQRNCMTERKKKNKNETILESNLILLIRLFSGCLGIRLQAIYFNMAIEFTNCSQTV